MTILGKKLSEYVRFQKWVLMAILAVGLVRLALSLACAPVDTVRLFSMTAVTLAGVLYCGIAVATRGFGSYRHLLPLLALQAVVANGIAIVGIALAGLTGRDNIFTAPEYTNLPNYWPHALGHAAAIIIVPLVLWPVAALVLWIARRSAGSPKGVASRT